jgi:hypothetical protein
MWDLWWTKWCWDMFSLSTSVSPANLHSADCSTITIIWGWYNRPVVAAVPSGLSLTALRIIKNKYAALLAAYFMLVSFLGYSSTPKMNAI